VSARSGAVCAPPGGPARFPARKISQRAESHACVGGYGLRWPRGTYVISARSRPGLVSRSRRDRARASRPPKAVATYLTPYAPVLVGICRAKKCPDPPVGARTAPGRGWFISVLAATTHKAASRREAQSGAYAPLQRRPTRPLPISRGPSPPLPTTHTLTRVGGPTGPCRWPASQQLRQQR
jgi:hypothetical protein